MMKLVVAFLIVAAVSAVTITIDNHADSGCSGPVKSRLKATGKCTKSGSVYVINNCNNCTSPCALFQYPDATCTGKQVKAPLQITAALGVGNPAFTDGTGFCLGTSKSRVFCSSGALAAPSMALLAFALLFGAPRLI